MNIFLQHQLQISSRLTIYHKLLVINFYFVLHNVKERSSVHQIQNQRKLHFFLTNKRNVWREFNRSLVFYDAVSWTLVKSLYTYVYNMLRYFVSILTTLSIVLIIAEINSKNNLRNVKGMWDNLMLLSLSTKKKIKNSFASRKNNKFFVASGRKTVNGTYQLLLLRERIVIWTTRSEMQKFNAFGRTCGSVVLIIWMSEW